VPQNVLQATYRHVRTGAYAVALRMRFETTEQAADFAIARSRDLQACRDQPDDRFSGAPAPVLTVGGKARLHSATYRLVGQRPVWLGGLQVQGTDVLTLDSDADPPDVLDWAGLGFRSA
jgi:hypothetical protein